MSRAVFLLCLLWPGMCAYAGWELVGGADAWARQHATFDENRKSDGMTFPFWRQASGDGSKVSAGVTLPSEGQLPLLLGGQQVLARNAAFSAETGGDSYSIRLSTRYEFPSEGKEQVTFQQSHAAYKLGNWFLGAGKIDWFWGPGWDSSMLLQTPEESPPVLFLQRALLLAPEASWLRWLGTWNAQFFAGQLEHDRDHSNAKLLGGRVTFSPVSGLELGLARTAMWGGEGRPENLSSFWKLIKGDDNCYVNCQATEPGNQLGGVDVRYQWGQERSRHSVYGSIVGEDEAGYLPAKNMYMFGTDWSTITGESDKLLTLFAEVSDTMADRMVGREQPNVSYRHHIYTDGYYYKGHVLGSSYGGDSRAYVLGALGQFDERIYWQLRLKKLELGWASQGLKTMGAEFGAEYRWQNLTLKATVAAYDDGAYLDGARVASIFEIRARLP